MAAEAGVDGVEALRHSLILPHQHTVLQVPEMNPLYREAEQYQTHQHHYCLKKKPPTTTHIICN